MAGECPAAYEMSVRGFSAENVTCLPAELASAQIGLFEDGQNRYHC